MALPIIPILIGGLVLLAAGGKKKGNGRPPHLPPGGGRVTMVPPNGAPPPGEDKAGQPCSGLTAPDRGAYDHDGNCVIFWDANTQDIFLQTAQGFMAEKGYTQDEVCAPDELVLDEWVPNPKRVEVVKVALSRIYEVTPGYWPPVEESPYWIDSTWNAGTGAILHALCGQ